MGFTDIQHKKLSALLFCCAGIITLTATEGGLGFGVSNLALHLRRMLPQKHRNTTHFCDQRYLGSRNLRGTFRCSRFNVHLRPLSSCGETLREEGGCWKLGSAAWPERRFSASEGPGNHDMDQMVEQHSYH